MIRYLACIASLIVAGCCAPSGANYDGDKASGFNSQGAKGVITARVLGSQPSQEVPPIIKADKDLAALFDKGGKCGPPKDPEPSRTRPGGRPYVGPVAVTFLVAASTFAIDRWAQHQDRKFEELKAAASVDESTQILVSPDLFLNGNCLVYMRFATDPKTKENVSTEEQMGLVVVMKIHGPNLDSLAALLADKERAADYFTVQPIFVRARNSIAITAPGKPIKVSVGVAVKQIGVLNGIPTLMAIGEAATTVTGVPLTGEALCADENCDVSSIIPIPASKGTIVLGVAVTETGNVGFNIDRRQAEVKAIAAAIGPVVGQIVQDHFKRESER